jgi:anti-sigma factor RsiW
MNCKDYKKHFISYLEGELPQDMANDIHKHIENCKSCANELAQMESVLSIIDEEKQEFKQNPYLAAKVLTRIQNKNVHVTQVRFSAQYFMAASLAAAGIAIGVIIGTLYSSSISTQTTNDSVQVLDQLSDDYMPEIENNPYNNIAYYSNETQEKP